MNEILGAERDVSRAHWQRTVGTVVMKHVAEGFMQNRLETFTTEQGPEEIVKHTEAHLGSLYGLGYADELAYATARVLFKTMKGVQTSLPDFPFEADWAEYTHTQRIDAASEEGFFTQAAFPINLARHVSMSAHKQGVSGYELRTLNEYADLLRRPDYHGMIEQAAFTRNGVWESFATGFAANFPNGVGGAPALEFEFSSDEVRFSEGFLHYLRSELAKVNRLGDAGRAHSEGIPLRTANVAGMSSSGCPAVHKRPHFTSSEVDQAALRTLAEYFGKDPAELTAPRQQSVIVDGLLMMADAMELVAEHSRRRTPNQAS